MQYRVLRGFRAVYGEREYSGLTGQTIELSQEVAEWLERDAPGRIRPEEPPPHPSPASQGRGMEGPPRDRMQRRKRNR